jgi:hypothetical protein
MVMKGWAFNVTTTYGFQLMGTDTEKYGSFASRSSFLFTLPRKICIYVCVVFTFVMSWYWMWRRTTYWLTAMNTYEIFKWNNLRKWRRDGVNFKEFLSDRFVFWNYFTFSYKTRPCKSRWEGTEISPFLHSLCGQCQLSLISEWPLFPTFGQFALINFKVVCILSFLQSSWCVFTFIMS